MARPRLGVLMADDAKTNNVVPFRSAMPQTKSEMLTPSRMQALRKRAKENSAHLREAFAHLRPENKSASPLPERPMSIAERIKHDHPDLSDDEIEELLRREGE